MLLRFALVRAHLPNARLAACQVPARVRHVEGFVGHDLSAVPQVALVLSKRFQAACNEDLVGRLPRPTARIVGYRVDGVDPA